MPDNRSSLINDSRDGNPSSCGLRIRTGLINVNGSRYSFSLGEHAPFFSIVVCTYNRAHILGRALRSLLAQDFNDWEAIVVDDGSIDGTRDLVQSFSQRSGKIRYLYQTHQGLVQARNTGVTASRGRYITFLDSDDEYLPYHLQSRHEVLSGSDIDFLHGGVSIVGNSWAPDREDPSILVPLSECAIGGTFFVTPRAFKAVGGFKKIPYAEDSEFYQRIKEKGLVASRIDIPSYRYHRTQKDSISRLVEEKAQNS